MQSPLSPGTICEISKAYNSETGQRDFMDELAHRVCELIEKNSDGSWLVYLSLPVEDESEWHVPEHRLKRI